MALELTNNTKRALSDLSIEPNIVFKIDRLDYYFSSGVVKDYIRIGDPDLFIGDDWRIGGFREIENNKVLIDSSSTNYTIRQQMNYDEGESNSVSSIAIGLIDKDQFVSSLISPGFLLTDILGRKCQVFVGFGTTSFSDDYLEVFKGYITEVESKSGSVIFKINHPDNKKKISLFKNISTKLTSSITSIDTTLSVESTDNFLDEVSGILGTYLVLGNEIVKYTIVNSTTMTITRAQLGTSATSHASDEQASSLYTLEGNPLTLALQIMLSGWGNDPVYSNIQVESFYKIGAGSDLNSHGIYFEGINLQRDFGIRAGDTITISGATSGANNFTDRTVLSVTKKDSGFYVVVDGADLVYEVNSSAVMSFKTQYNVLAQGMRMTPDEVDIDQHEFIRDFFQPATEMRFYLKEDIDNGKEFIEKELYKPIACYSLPRKAKSSVGYSVGPIPGSLIKSININTVKSAKNASIKRTTSRAFFNEVVYKYDESPVGDSGKYLKGYVLLSQTSKNQIPGTNRTYKVESLGLKTDLNADNIVQAESQRIIDRYSFAAESVYVSALLKDSVDTEIGDIVVLEGKGIQLTDITTGNRLFEPRLFEVRNTEVNLKSGDVTYELLDTGLGVDTRYGLMSPVSEILGVISQSKVVIGFVDDYASAFASDEYRNWESVFELGSGINVILRDANFSFIESNVISSIVQNTFTFSSPMVTTILPGMILDFDSYNNDSTKQHLVYAFMQDSSTFDDSSVQYTMI